LSFTVDHVKRKGLREGNIVRSMGGKTRTALEVKSFYNRERNGVGGQETEGWGKRLKYFANGRDD